MKCVHCSAQNDRNYLSCVNCGRPRVIVPPGQAGNVPPVPSQSRTPRPAPRKVDMPKVIVPPGYQPPARRAGRPGPAQVARNPGPAQVPPNALSNRPAAGATPPGPPNLAPVSSGSTGPDPSGAKQSHKGRIIAIFTGLITLGTAALAAIPAITGGGKDHQGPGTVTAAVTVNNVIVQPGEFRPPPAPQGGSEVDPCLAGRWIGISYTRKFQVDTTAVDLRAEPGASFEVTFRDDGTGTETISSRTVLTGSGGGYNVTMAESGTSRFRYVGHDGDLAVETTDGGSYDFSVVINGTDIPKDELQYSGNYTITYTCSADQLVLTGDFFHLEYVKG